MMGSGVGAASAESTLQAKPEWSKDSRSDRQLSDARGIVCVEGDKLDREYLTAWAAELGERTEWADSWSRTRRSDAPGDRSKRRAGSIVGDSRAQLV